MAIDPYETESGFERISPLDQELFEKKSLYDVVTQGLRGDYPYPVSSTIVGVQKDDNEAYFPTGKTDVKIDDSILEMYAPKRLPKIEKISGSGLTEEYERLAQELRGQFKKGRSGLSFIGEKTNQPPEEDEIYFRNLLSDDSLEKTPLITFNPTPGLINPLDFNGPRLGTDETVSDLTRALLEITFDSSITTKTREIPEISPVDSRAAHKFRKDRFASLGGYAEMAGALVERWQATRDVGRTYSGYMSPKARRDTFDKTQFRGENHRLLTPRIQEIFRQPEQRAKLMDSIDVASKASTEAVIERAKSGERPEYDLVVIGSGPQGTAVASTVRELYPKARILIVESGDKLGGQFRTHGPNPAFYMNSRVRREDRTLEPIPRTPASINPMGDYATVQLSDVVTTDYADNTQVGDITAINAHLSTDEALLGVECLECRVGPQSAILTVRTKEGLQFDVKASEVFNATGKNRKSALPELERVGSNWLWTTERVYAHFGNKEGAEDHNPLQAFHDKKVIVIGDGDGALTAMEAILGKLAPETYGMYGPGRYSPKEIVWVNAPGLTSGEVAKCLRSRYQNGIVQALPKKRGDQGAKIRPITTKATGVSERFVFLGSGRKEIGDIVIDCTNRPSRDKPINVIRGATELTSYTEVGPASSRPLPTETTRLIQKLGIPENTVALWTTMPVTVKEARGAVFRLMLRKETTRRGGLTQALASIAITSVIGGKSNMLSKDKILNFVDTSRIRLRN